MSKRRQIQGDAKEIMHFYIANFSKVAGENQTLIADLKESFWNHGIAVLEFSTAGGTFSIINESKEFEHKLTLQEIYDILDKYGLESSFRGSEFV
jgi:hypothetical protein